MCADMCCWARWLQVEAQIEAVSKTVDQATKALPNLTREQQVFQVSARHCALRQVFCARSLQHRLLKLAGSQLSGHLCLTVWSHV
jgi:epoxyqueuosine reductase QueG